MKYLYLSCFAIFFFLGISSCTKYDPIYGVGQNSTIDPIELKKDLVYIHRNDIYLVNEILSDQKKLSNTPTSTKTHIVLSPLHDKIAYLNANKTPVIIDTSGTQIDLLNQYSNVTDLFWHDNNGAPTLVILVNNTIQFYGPTLNIDNNPFEYAFPLNVTFEAIDAIHINENLDILFTFRYQVPFTPTSTLRKYYHGVGVNFSSSTPDKSNVTEDGVYSPISSSYSNQSYPYYHMIKYNEAADNASLSRVNNGGENNYNAYSLAAYNYVGTSNFLSNQTTTLNNGENYYFELNEGSLAANPYQIRKYLVTLPTGVPPPTGTANTYTIDFLTQNSSAPTYFDWNP
ncbi:MAG: Unknown protein [uncultured Aureispira sp.]|uniref:Uncharacterized protein n=1 Tax=uncultured Aureispira sp. TaxID=1331704 RepID=A0A6S6TND9_9BACT|nr:MAG: Unknown protein [uncultured Aureispira sp.]